jgi:hypothetical protein
MDSHLIIFERSVVRVVRFRDQSGASDVPFTSSVARLREHSPEPLFVVAFFIGLLATLEVLVGNT